MTNACAKKKRLRRIGRRVSIVSANGGVSRISSAASAEHPGTALSSAGVLLLSPVRRCGSVGSACGSHSQAFDARGRGIGDAGGHGRRELRGGGEETASEDGVV